MKNHFRQTLAFDEIHREIMLPFVCADFVDGDDVRMLQLRRRFRLGAKPAHLRVARQPSGQNHFHRHDAVEIHLPRLPDHAHAAARDLLQQFVIAKVTNARTGRRRRFGNHREIGNDERLIFQRRRLGTFQRALQKTFRAQALRRIARK